MEGLFATIDIHRGIFASWILCVGSVSAASEVDHFRVV